MIRDNFRSFLEQEKGKQVDYTTNNNNNVNPYVTCEGMSLVSKIPLDL